MSESLAYSPGSTPQGLQYTPGAGYQGDQDSLLAGLIASSGGSGGLSGLSSYSGNQPTTPMGSSAGGAGYRPNSGMTGSSAGTQYAGLGNTLASNAGNALSLFNIGNLTSKAATGTGLVTGLSNLARGFDWSGMATGSLLDSLSAQAASDIAGGLGTDAAIVGGAGLGAGAAAGASALAGMSAVDLATLSAAIPGLAGTFGGLASAAALTPLAAL